MCGWCGRSVSRGGDRYSAGGLLPGRGGMTSRTGCCVLETTGLLPGGVGEVRLTRLSRLTRPALAPKKSMAVLGLDESGRELFIPLIEKGSFVAEPAKHNKK